MPNRTFHLATSGPAGALFAYANAPGNNAIPRILEMVGGGLGGLAGGALPDVLDPPAHPCHRSWAHGIVPVAAGAAYWGEELPGWQDAIRRQADRFAQLRASERQPLLAAWYAIVEVVLRLCCGFLAGAGAGYVTHLALDFTTPRCLPVLA